MKVFKDIIKYIIIFVIVVFFLTLLLTIVSKIPRKYVEVNLQEAVEFFKENNEPVTMIKRKIPYTFLYPDADQIILNIIYCLNTDNPLESVLEAKYYIRMEQDGSNLKYVELIKNDMEPNAEYSRYWHGSIVIIKPLLVFFTLEQIFILCAITLSILTIVLLAILIRKKYFSIAISLVIGLIMVAVWYVPFTFSYSWTFLLMLIASIIAVRIESRNNENKNKKLYMLFFITGILTCYLDFLMTEIITILVPLVIVLSMRIKDKKFIGFKKEFIFIATSLILWLIGYAGMFLAKWIITSVVLNKDIISIATEKALIRVNGQVLRYTRWELIKYSIIENIISLYPINLIKRQEIILATIVIIIATVWLIIIDKKNKPKMKYMLLMILLAISPYIRYMVLSNHSYVHKFFTFRSQLPTIMSIVLILTNCTDKKKLLSQIKKQKNKITKSFLLDSSVNKN